MEKRLATKIKKESLPVVGFSAGQKFFSGKVSSAHSKENQKTGVGESKTRCGGHN